MCKNKKQSILQAKISLGWALVTTSYNLKRLFNLGKLLTTTGDWGTWAPIRTQMATTTAFTRHLLEGAYFGDYLRFHPPPRALARAARVVRCWASTALRARRVCSTVRSASTTSR